MVQLITFNNQQINKFHTLMKIYRIAFIISLIFIMFLLGIKIYRSFIISRYFEKEEKIKFKKSAEVLNECFDFKNKSQRTINDSMKLIEYCLKEYGYEK